MVVSRNQIPCDASELRDQLYKATQCTHAANVKQTDYVTEDEINLFLALSGKDRVSRIWRGRSEDYQFD